MPFVLALLVVLVFASTATAQVTTASYVDDAVENLQRESVYVHPDADALTDGEAEALAARIRESGAAPLYVAVLPEAARDEAGGSTEGLVQRIGTTLVGNGAPRSSVVAVVAGGQFRAGGPNGTGRAATQAAQAHPGDLPAALGAFADRIGELRRGAAGGAGGNGGGGNGDGGDGGAPWGLLALLGVGGGAFALSRRAKRKREQDELAEVKANVRDDLVALGDDIRALDLDVQMPNADRAAVADYERAVVAYQRAEDAWESAKRVDDLEPVGSALEEGRWAMSSAKARLAGQTPPERRAPCFFDPRHGPSTRDVEWAPPGGAPRPVPACEADALRVEAGEDPASREVVVGGRSMPYWAAGPAYMPLMGGFFGGGLLPGLMMGTMLGSMFDGPDVAHGAGDWGGGFGGGDFGGGGGFGGGGFGDGGGFGGGDFGGGDF